MSKGRISLESLPYNDNFGRKLGAVGKHFVIGKPNSEKALELYDEIQKVREISPEGLVREIRFGFQIEDFYEVDYFYSVKGREVKLAFWPVTEGFRKEIVNLLTLKPELDRDRGVEIQQGLLVKSDKGVRLIRNYAIDTTLEKGERLFREGSMADNLLYSLKDDEIPIAFINSVFTKAGEKSKGKEKHYEIVEKTTIIPLSERQAELLKGIVNELKRDVYHLIKGIQSGKFDYDDLKGRLFMLNLYGVKTDEILEKNFGFSLMTGKSYDTIPFNGLFPKKYDLKRVVLLKHSNDSFRKTFDVVVNNLTNPSPENYKNLLGELLGKKGKGLFKTDNSLVGVGIIVRDEDTGKYATYHGEEILYREKPKNFTPLATLFVKWEGNKRTNSLELFVSPIPEKDRELARQVIEERREKIPELMVKAVEESLLGNGNDALLGKIETVFEMNETFRRKLFESLKDWTGKVGLNDDVKKLEFTTRADWERHLVIRSFYSPDKDIVIFGKDKDGKPLTIRPADKTLKETLEELNTFVKVYDPEWGELFAEFGGAVSLEKDEDGKEYFVLALFKEEDRETLKEGIRERLFKPEFDFSQNKSVKDDTPNDDPDDGFDLDDIEF